MSFMSITEVEENVLPYLLGACYCVIFIFGCTCNSIILDIIRVTPLLNRGHVSFVIQFVICDLGASIFAVIPPIVSSFSKSWILGTDVCTFSGMIWLFFSFVRVEILVLLAIETLVALKVKREEHQYLFWTKDYLLTYGILMWLLGALFALCFSYIPGWQATIVYDKRFLICHFDFSLEYNSMYIIASLLQFIPFVLTIAILAAALRNSRKGTEVDKARLNEEYYAMTVNALRTDILNNAKNNAVKLFRNYDVVLRNGRKVEILKPGAMEMEMDHTSLYRSLATTILRVACAGFICSTPYWIIWILAHAESVQLISVTLPAWLSMTFVFFTYLQFALDPIILLGYDLTLKQSYKLWKPCSKPTSGHMDLPLPQKFFSDEETTKTINDDENNEGHSAIRAAILDKDNNELSEATSDQGGNAWNQSSSEEKQKAMNSRTPFRFNPSRITHSRVADLDF